jgi:uncharacterized RDD family membrane protein YckC
MKVNNAMPHELVLAGRLRRLIATLIDAILVPVLTLFLVMVAGVVEDAEDYIDNWWALWVFLLAVASYLILNGYGLWRRGQTVGKMVMRIAIVRADGVLNPQPGSSPAPLWKLICIRALFFPLMFAVVVPPYALLPIIDQLFVFGKRRRCLHDLVAGTVVVRVASAQPK